MPSVFDWVPGMGPPTATPIEPTGAWDTPAGVPVDRFGNSLIPELAHRSPTHNESILIARMPVAMASSNVDEIWWNWGAGETYDPKLFVRFLGGSLYSYNGPLASLSVAVGMVETMSPGRYVWNVLRTLFPVPDSKGTGPGTYTELVKGAKGAKRKPQVVRLVDRGPGRFPRGTRVTKWRPGMLPPR